MAKKPNEDGYPVSHAIESVEEVIDSHIDTKAVGTTGSPGTPQRFLPSRGASRETESVKLTRVKADKPRVPFVTLIGPEEEAIAEPTQKTPDSTQDDKKTMESDQYASKMSPVDQITRTDSYGRSLCLVPSSVKGRYQPLPADDESLQPVSIGRKAALAATEMGGEDKSDADTAIDDDDDDDKEMASEEEVESVGKPTLLQRLAQQMTNPTAVEEPSQSGKMTAEQALAKLLRRSGKADDNQNEGASTSRGAESSRARTHSDGFASSVAVVAKLMKWTTKTKAVTESLEKYPGHLRDVRDRGRQEKTELPFPLIILVKQEALPIVHNIAKAYRLAMGKHHKLTREAYARYEELKNELSGSDVFL